MRMASPLENDSVPASLLLPMGRLGPAFLAFPNFDVYLQWNQSLNYATTAAYLATRIDGAPAMRRGARGHPRARAPRRPRSCSASSPPAASTSARSTARSA